jgi:hypothetical protein
VAGEYQADTSFKPRASSSQLSSRSPTSTALAPTAVTDTHHDLSAPRCPFRGAMPPTAPRRTQTLHDRRARPRPRSATVRRERELFTLGAGRSDREEMTSAGDRPTPSANDSLDCPLWTTAAKCHTRVLHSAPPKPGRGRSAGAGRGRSAGAGRGRSAGAGRFATDRDGSRRSEDFRDGLRWFAMVQDDSRRAGGRGGRRPFVAGGGRSWRAGAVRGGRRRFTARAGRSTGKRRARIVC